MTAHDAQECPLSGASPGVSLTPYLPLDHLCGPRSSMHTLLERARRLIDRQLPLLLLGETGTGKEYLARALHKYSRRRRAALIALNCASIPDNLVESELFGYQRGAFSGALPGGMKGKVVLADRGTLFLDEVGDMPAAQQTRLLRVLSEGEVTPIGAAQPIAVDVQLICATHQDLAQRVERGEFREDLYYRIAVGVLELPALRERDDRAWLLQSMLTEEMPGRTLDDTLCADALDLLMTYTWPGNLRQMRAALRYACAVKNGDTVTLADLPAQITQKPRTSVTVAQPATPLPYVHAGSSNDAFIQSAPAAHEQREERNTLIRVLAESRWNISAAARRLGMCRASLYRKLKQFDIPHVRDMGRDLISASDMPSPRAAPHGVETHPALRRIH
ncbi:sigma-54-dependent Fis family transcriptional regulator [Burkholderia sp. L27(2015)]|uniref:sigma-54-dependent Fis family transcriptional regulator n=1 Tax=Burkholderia sp. L27(2015) TaxID=1641858 RepID=UPI00131ECF4F|nr:sigma 54-interacting transcriptional regulator [Burkholderia sp. L27(2015)]